MNSDPGDLPADVAESVDAWLDGGGDEALDRLEASLADAGELDGDLTARWEPVQRDLAATARPRRALRWAVALAAVAAVWAVGTVLPLGGHGVVTAEEASAPVMVQAVRGDSPAAGLGPQLRLVQPRAGEVLTARTDLLLEALPGAYGAAIDPGSLTVTYLRGHGVEITERLGGRWVGSRYVADGLRFPVGSHPLAIAISDTDLETTVVRVVLERRE